MSSIVLIGNDAPQHAEVRVRYNAIILEPSRLRFADDPKCVVLPYMLISILIRYFVDFLSRDRRSNYGNPAIQDPLGNLGEGIELTRWQVPPGEAADQICVQIDRTWLHCGASGG